MTKRVKTRESKETILDSCSDALFPAELGRATVTVHSKGCDGDTALHVMLRRKNTYAALLLIEAGADVNAVGDMSETPLHIAVKKQDVVAVKALISAGANLSLVSEFGHSPMNIAKEQGGEILRLFPDY